MNTKRNVGIAALAALLTLFSVITIAPLAAQSSNSETLLIGFIGASAGRQGELDQQLYQAAMLAAEQINAGDDDDDEGIAGPSQAQYDLSITYYAADTLEEVVDAYDDAVNDGAIAIVGPHDQEALAALEDQGTPDVAILSAVPDAPTSSRFYRLSASYETQTQAAADYLVNERNFTRIAVITTDTTVGSEAADVFDQAITQDVIVAQLENSADEEDFLDDARTIRDARAQAIFAWTLDAQMIALLDALDSVGWEGEMIYAGLDAGFVESAGVEQTQDVMGMTAWTASAYDSTSQSFAVDYQTRWETAAPDAAAAYYDAVFLLADAVSKAGDTASSISTQLSNTTALQGVQGEYNRAQTDSLLLVQVTDDGGLIEAARYAAGDCVTCLDTWWVDTTGETATADETFNLGLITTGSGPAQVNGENIEQAARLAVREINEAGGILRNGTRYTLNLQVYSASSTDEASTVFDQAVSDGMQIIIGPDYNAQILPNLTTASTAGLIQLVSATSGQIVTTEADDVVYQLRANDDALVAATVDYLVNVQELTRFAFVAARTDYGLDAADQFADLVDDSDDAELVLSLDHDLSESDFSAMAQRIVDANVEVAAIWSTPPAAQVLATALEGLGWQGELVYGYLTPDSVAQLTETSLKVIAPVNWWDASRDWASQDFSTRYTTRYGESPISQSPAYYDAVYLIATALQNAGTTTSSLQSWLTNVESFSGVQGDYTPNRYDTGELIRALTMIQVDAEGVQEIARYDDTTCLWGCE